MLTSPKRYNKSNFVRLLSDDYELLGTEFIRNILRDSVLYEYEVPENQAYRIDLISRTLYNNTDLYWVIMTINSLVYVQEIHARRIIKYATLNDIEKAYFNWKRSL